MRELTMFAVDLSSHRAEIALEILVLLDILTAGYCYLDENNFILQLRVVVEKSVKAAELLCQTFDVVQPIDAYNHLDALITFFQSSDAILDLRQLQSVGELLRVNANNELVRADEAVLILDLVWNLGTCITAVV